MSGRNIVSSFRAEGGGSEEAQSDMARIIACLRRAAESVLVAARWEKKLVTALNAKTLLMRKGRVETETECEVEGMGPRRQRRRNR